MQYKTHALQLQPQSATGAGGGSTEAGWGTTHSDNVEEYHIMEVHGKMVKVTESNRLQYYISNGTGSRKVVVPKEEVVVTWELAGGEMTPLPIPLVNDDPTALGTITSKRLTNMVKFAPNRPAPFYLLAKHVLR